MNSARLAVGQFLPDPKPRPPRPIEEGHHPSHPGGMDFHLPEPRLHYGQQSLGHSNLLIIGIETLFNPASTILIPKRSKDAIITALVLSSIPSHTITSLALS